MLLPAMYANGETEGPFETGTLEDDISLELDNEYQSIPSTRFEVTMVSPLREMMDLPLRPC